MMGLNVKIGFMSYFYAIDFDNRNEVALLSLNGVG